MQLELKFASIVGMVNQKQSYRNLDTYYNVQYTKLELVSVYQPLSKSNLVLARRVKF